MGEACPQAAARAGGVGVRRIRSGAEGPLTGLGDGAEDIAHALARAEGPEPTDRPGEVMRLQRDHHARHPVQPRGHAGVAHFPARRGAPALHQRLRHGGPPKRDVRFAGLRRTRGVP